MPTTVPTFLTIVAHNQVQREMRRLVAALHTQWPQYDGYFESWRLAYVSDNVRGKGSSELPAGSIVLACPDLAILDGEPVTRSAYCPTSGHIVAVPHECIRLM